MTTEPMGSDPKKSLRNKFGEAHDVKDRMAVDGACIVTSGVCGPRPTIGKWGARAPGPIFE